MCFRHPLQGLLVCLIAAGAILVPPGRGDAAQDSVFTVSGVFVDVTAETATAARETAIAQAHGEAMQRLFRRLVMEQDLSRLPALTPDQVADFVHDFSVSDERTAPGRYLADFTFRFNPAEVRALFQQYGVRFAETQSKPLVVVPVWGGGKEALLWEETNPWLRAWSDRHSDEGLVPLITPLADLGDVTTLNVGQALAGEATPLGSLAARYRAEGALVAQAVLLGGIEDGTASLAVTTSRLLEDGLNKLGVLNVKQNPGEDLPRLLERATAAVSEMAALRWKEANLLNFADRQTIAVRVPIASLDGWLEIRRRLEDTATVLAADVLYLRRDEAKLDLTFVGSEEQLIRALTQRDLELARNRPDGLGLEPLRQSRGVAAGASLGVPLPSEPQWELRLLGEARSEDPAAGASGFQGSLLPQPQPSIGTTE